MVIKIVTIGKKSKDLQPVIDEYQKRLSSTQKIEWDYIMPSSFDEQKARIVESELITTKLKPNDIVWLLDERGEQVTSPALASKINVLKSQAASRLVIIIGGAYGVSDELRSSVNWQWSLSRLVFPHQLVRLILIEQLYRADQIYKGSAYHHA